jgi:hypothetical protein
VEIFRLDYLSCLLTVVATILVGGKRWTGLVVSGVNSLIVCIIGVHTSQYGFIPANVFCICVYAFNLKLWLKNKEQPRPNQISTLAEAEHNCHRDRQQSALGESLTHRTQASNLRVNFPMRSGRVLLVRTSLSKHDI